MLSDLIYFLFEFLYEKLYFCTICVIQTLNNVVSL
jgi:hypothetical protein